jgi:hypothetical protein
MSRTIQLLAVLALLLLVSAVHAQIGFDAAARYLGMGNTGIAAANDVSAIDFNPANLGVMEINPMGLPSRYWYSPNGALDEKIIPAQVIGSGSLAGNADLAAGYAGALIADEVHKKHGFAIGWKGFSGPEGSGPQPKSESIVLGYGHQYYYENWSWGFSYAHGKTTGIETYLSAAAAPYTHEITNSLNAGSLFWLPRGAMPTLRAGMVIQDVLGNNVGPLVNIGLSWSGVRNLEVNADYVDLFESEGSLLNVGAEYRIAPAWCVRLGDINLGRQQGVNDAATVGAGWAQDKWNVDLAYISPPAGVDLDKQWVVSGSYEF